MKLNKLSLALLVFIIPGILTCQTIWQQLNPCPPSNQLYDVYFTNESEGWGVGNKNVIVHSADGGESWTRQYAYASYELSCVFFCNENTGFIGAREVYKTNDGGASWESVFSLYPNNSVKDIFFIDELTGWICGSNGTIFKTEDGGENWTDQSLPIYDNLSNIYFINENIGWAISSKKALLKTTNGGSDWEYTDYGSSFFSFTDIFFLDEQQGWISGSNGYLWYSENGGDTWDTIQVNTEENFKNVRFFNENKGLLIGRHNLYKTIDGGSTWDVKPYISTHMNAGHFPTENFGCVVGGSINYTNDEGNSWQLVDKGFSEDISSIHCFDNANIIIAGEDGIIKKSDDEGNTWTDQASNTDEDLDDMCFIDENNGWVIGWHTILLNSIDGGSNWTEIQTGYSDKYNAIFFTDNQHGWIATNEGNIIKTINGGETWYTIYCGFSFMLYDIFFINNQKGWATGDDGTIAVSNDGGETWTVQNNPLTYNLYSIYFTDSLHGWLGGNRTILHTQNGGEEWTIQFLDESYLWPQFKALSFSDSLHGWAVGNCTAMSRSHLLHTNDGGANWILQTDGLPGDKIRSIFFTDSNHGYIGGRDGTFLSTKQGTYMAPSIQSQPLDTIVCSGTNLFLEIEATGDSLEFLWRKNHVDIEGINSNSLLFNPVSPLDAGLYSCKVLNKAGMLIVDNFTVTVQTPASISANPQDIEATVNDTAIFNLAVTGALPFNYQWQKNNEDIPGANFHIYPIYGVQQIDTGYYKCIISNDCNTVISDSAKLTVQPLGISDHWISEGQISIYPNPADNYLFIEFPMVINTISCQIYNSKGALINSFDLRKQERFRINCAPYLPGVYFLQLSDGKNMFSTKFIKR